ncbi:MAG: hypothetical protein P4L42_07845 [Desulfocapsaceae bacterium]|nr:hypothetical protein [Desulfocapsaceae bacterium]
MTAIVLAGRESRQGLPEQKAGFKVEPLARTHTVGPFAKVLILHLNRGKT